MSIRKKFILIGICIVIILAIFTVNVIRRMKTDSTDVKDIVVKENVITRAEAFRLLSYLEYDRAGRETLQKGITYADKNMSDWYDSYMNAVWKMGLIEGNITVSPKEALTYGACKDIVNSLLIKYPVYQGVLEQISFDFIQADEEMIISDFLELYNAIIHTKQEEELPLKEETLFVLGKEGAEKGPVRMITDQGKFYYGDARSYVKYLTQNNNEVSFDTKEIVDQYLDQGIKALVSGTEIIYIASPVHERMVVQNVWIKKGDGTKVETFVGGIHKTFEAQFPLSSSIEKVIGNIAIENKQIVQISIKADKINGKVLLAGDDFIEVEGYGKVPLEEDFRIYKIYGELSLEPTSSILVGYEATDFIVSNGKISAALIKESIKAENIRVLLKTSNYDSLYHNKVELTADSDFTISHDEKETKYKAGEVVSMAPGDVLLSDGRIKVETDSDLGKVEIKSMQRSYGNPKYRGTIEIAEGENGLVIINELPMEEYLYAVIPSEMPTYYGVESLKVQAVCARSYAYKHLMANSLSNYGAHVDDSISYQVYNNIEENENSILAVKDTYGKVVEYQGEVITAYYFSTSCGHTTAVEHVWANGKATPYLTGRLMAVPDEDVDVFSITEDRLNLDLSKEKNFRNFITKEDVTTYDSEFNWYRWNVTIDVVNLQKVIDNKLKGRYNANPELIQTKVKRGGEEIYESIPVDTIGSITDIKVLKRETGGIISELLIEGSKNTIKVKTEYNIRALLAPTYNTVIRKDSSEVNNLSLLPSAFFVIDKNEDKGKLKSIKLMGGGYGHGVGMSQNGVKAMADSGKSYEDIVKYFYKGTEMGFIYE